MNKYFCANKKTHCIYRFLNNQNFSAYCRDYLLPKQAKRKVFINITTIRYDNLQTNKKGTGKEVIFYKM